MTHRVSGIAAILTSAFFACIAQAQSVVAMVTDVQGAVSVARDGKTSAPTIATSLVPGMRVEVRPGASLSALELASGDQIVVTGPAIIELRDQAFSVTPASSLHRKSTRLGQVKLRQDRLAQAAMVMRSASIERLPLVTPVNSVILDTRPVFRWSPVNGAGPYRFELLDDNGNSLYQTRTSGAELALPDGIRLMEDKSYTWEVSTRRSDGARFESVSDFSIASARLREAATQLRPAADAPVSEWAAYAIWLEGGGLAEMAREAWSHIAQQRPDDPALKVLSTR